MIVGEVAQAVSQLAQPLDPSAQPRVMFHALLDLALAEHIQLAVDECVQLLRFDL